MTDKPTSKFGPVSAILITLLAFLGSQVLAALIIGSVLTLTGKESTEAAQALTDTTVGRFVFVFVVEAMTLSILLWFMKHRKISLAEIGLGRKPQFSDASWSLISFVGYFIIVACVLYAVGQLIPGINLDQKQEIGFENNVGSGFFPLLLVFISLVVLPPVVEEIMIRGFLYTGLRRKLGKIAAAIIASLIFGAAHLQLGEGAPPLYVAAIDTFVLSLVLIWLREKTGSLWAGMLVHALKNGLAFMALFVFGAS